MASWLATVYTGWLRWLYFASEAVKKALSHARKKTVMLIVMMALHTEKGGIWVECELGHKSSEQ
jgi:hypothetical protein